MEVEKMPWEERTKETMREEFAQQVELGKKTMSELCREYGISRQTGYKWKQRYKDSESMEDRSKAPHEVHHKTPKEEEQKILTIRSEHPSIGALKIHRILENNGESNIPCVKTINNIMKRNGMITREASEAATPYQRFEMSEPNDMWQMDFKGHFAIGTGERCHPLNIIDDNTRFLICSDACQNETLEEIMGSLNRCFTEYGLPKIILCDNGNPWGNAQQTGFTKFEVRMMEMGILVIHGRILHPQTQGKIERFNETQQKELLRTHIFIDFENTQKQFDMYREFYNYERPHLALNLATPGSLYQKSPRKMPDLTAEWSYGDGYLLRDVHSNGCFTLNGRQYFLSYGFAGKTIAVRESKIPGLLTLEFRNFRIARIDPSTHRFVSKKAELLY